MMLLPSRADFLAELRAGRGGTVTLNASDDIAGAVDAIRDAVGLLGRVRIRRVTKDSWVVDLCQPGATPHLDRLVPMGGELPYARNGIDDKGFYLACPACEVRCRAEGTATSSAHVAYTLHFEAAAAAEKDAS